MSKVVVKPNRSGFFTKIILGMIAAGFLLAVVGSCIWVEFILVPQILTKAGYPNAVVLHVVVTLALVLAAGVAGAWLSGRTIFSVQEKLVAPHLNSVVCAIEKVVSGAWSNEAAVQKQVFMTGAKLGYEVREQMPPPERQLSPPRREQIVESLAGMALPQAKALTGDSPEVIENMSSYLNNIDSRKERLSR